MKLSRIPKGINSRLANAVNKSGQEIRIKEAGNQSNGPAMLKAIQAATFWRGNGGGGMYDKYIACLIDKFGGAAAYHYGDLDIEIPAARLRRALTILVVVLTALSFVGTLGDRFLHLRLSGFVDIFDVDAETSIPNWYSAVALAVSAALLAATAAASRARKQTRDLPAWTALTLIFTFLSLDEIAGIHERVGRRLHYLLHLDGFFRFAWVVPALVLVALVGATFLPFLSRLPARRRRQFVAAGLIFVGGAVGMEMIGAKVYTAAGENLTLAFVVCYHLEEFMEMLGIVLFNAALIEHLAELLGAGGLRLRFVKD